MDPADRFYDAINRKDMKALADVVTFALPKPKADELAEAARRATEAARARLRELEAAGVLLRLPLHAVPVKPGGAPVLAKHGGDAAQAAPAEHSAKTPSAAVEKAQASANKIELHQCLCQRP